MRMHDEGSPRRGIIPSVTMDGCSVEVAVYPEFDALAGWLRVSSRLYRALRDCLHHLGGRFGRSGLRRAIRLLPVQWSLLRHGCSPELDGTEESG